jgi:hypothetical protein
LSSARTHAHAGVRGPVWKRRPRPSHDASPTGSVLGCLWLMRSGAWIALAPSLVVGTFGLPTGRGRPGARLHFHTTSPCTARSPLSACPRRARTYDEDTEANVGLPSCCCSAHHRLDATKACDNPRRCTSQAEKSATCCAGTPRLRATFKPAQTMSAPLHKLPRKHRRRDDR